MKNELELFIEELLKISTDANGSLTIEQQRAIVNKINAFLFSNDKSLGETDALDRKWPYISAFHKYWEQNCQEILGLTIHEESCSKVADILHDVYSRSKGALFSGITGVDDRGDLSDEEVCKLRFFTANQDFRGSRKFVDIVRIYKSNPSLFELKNISSNPDAFVNAAVGNFSQIEKRGPYAKAICDFLTDNNTTEPYDIISHFNNDIQAFRQALILYPGSGYGEKKTDMFIRDMVVSGVWSDVKNFDSINVASDINTIKVALRTGILRSQVPLVSSFLDIFSPQYGLVDAMTSKAWRRVWTIWRERYPNECIVSPCLIDFLIYRIIGRQICGNNKLVYMKCENGHIYKWANARKKKCPHCGANAELFKHDFPCNDTDASVIVCATELYKQTTPGYKQCPFKELCDNYNKKYLNPPKSISIINDTGWSTAYTSVEAGGGGIMA